MLNCISLFFKYIKHNISRYFKPRKYIVSFCTRNDKGTYEFYSYMMQSEGVDMAEVLLECRRMSGAQDACIVSIAEAPFGNYTDTIDKGAEAIKNDVDKNKDLNSPALDEKFQSEDENAEKEIEDMFK